MKQTIIYHAGHDCSHGIIFDNNETDDLQISKRVYTRPVHKNFFLEFPKYPGRFMLHFDIQTNVRKGVLLKYRSFIKFWEPPILQVRIHGAKLSESGLGPSF